MLSDWNDFMIATGKLTRKCLTVSYRHPSVSIHPTIVAGPIKYSDPMHLERSPVLPFYLPATMISLSRRTSGTKDMYSRDTQYTYKQR